MTETPELLQSVKDDLGITTNRKDASLLETIIAAKLELRMHGVNTIHEDDPLTVQAIKYYCRGDKNFQGDGERYMKAFEHIADGMALSGDFNGVPR